MGSRIREKPKRMFEFFLEVSKCEGKAPTISRRFPATYTDEGVVAEIPKFAFPCETDGSKVDHFNFVVPDLSGMFRFGFCRHATGHQTCLCVVSWLPWFDAFYKMLDIASELLAESGGQRALAEFLQEIYDHEVPGPKIPVSIIASQQMFNFTAPDPSELPRIPGNVNLTEYYNALDTANMVVVFASMLQERRIYMMSKRLNRLTSCIHAAEALLYPMNWQHTFIPVLPGHVIECLGLMTPYIIGVHGNLVSRLDELQEDLEDAVFVDLDTNTVTSEHDDLGRLPWNVVSALKKDLKAEKIKDSMSKTGEAISMAFLKANVRLIGGYRDALKMRPGEPVTFDEKVFIQSRSSTSFQSYLEGMLSLQLFQEFVQGRVDSLNAGVRVNDIFEQQVAIYAERHGKKNRSNFKDLKVKIKKQSRKAISTVISGLMVDYEEKKGDKMKVNSDIFNPNFQQGTINDAEKKTAMSQSLHIGAPSDDPKAKLPIRPMSAIITRDISQDDSGVSLSYQSPNMSLLDDLDIQEVLRRSPSSEILSRQCPDTGRLSSASSSSSLEESDNPGSTVGSVAHLKNDPNKAETAKKTTPGEADTLNKDKLIRPGAKDKLIRPAKSDSSKKSSVRSSPLSRLLSTRRSRDSPAAASQSNSSKPPSGLPVVKESSLPVVSPSSVKASTKLPSVWESQGGESLTGGNTNTSAGSQAGEFAAAEAGAPAPLIVFDSNDSVDGQFDPLAGQSSDPGTSAQSGTDQSLMEAFQSLTSVEPSNKTSSTHGDSEGFPGLDIFGSVAFTGQTSGVSSAFTGQTSGVSNAFTGQTSGVSNVFTGQTPGVSGVNAPRERVTGINVSPSFSTQRMPNSYSMSQPQQALHQRKPMATPASQMGRAPTNPMTSQFSSMSIQPGTYPAGMTASPAKPGMSVDPSPILRSPLGPPTPGPQTQTPPFSYSHQSLSSPLSPSPRCPAPTQWVMPAAQSSPGSSTVSSVFAARARDSRAAVNNPANSAKSQADLLSDLIGVDFGAGNQQKKQPQQADSLPWSQPR